ncbi:MAG: glycosyltransferase, partial [Pelolinea sp.]|nr:glycosyltransferase [Pelolinea sp.]
MTSKISNKPHWAIIHPFQLRLQRGIETYVWGLSAALARSGVEVDIITWDGPLTVPEDVKAAGVQIFAMPNFRYFEGFFASIYY